ncbi:hypothetical protein CRG98_018416 [Punica granatum]|uniref:Uncharacterized protein n=1 Tax=Punica granatum TaxID=22663 RepID=A0A2I0JY17_PUNGR|nr:hypothetical protein CRG98_018416 [Punica granatum]
MPGDDKNNHPWILVLVLATLSFLLLAVNRMSTLNFPAKYPMYKLKQLDEEVKMLKKNLPSGREATEVYPSPPSCKLMASNPRQPPRFEFKVLGDDRNDHPWILVLVLATLSFLRLAVNRMSTLNFPAKYPMYKLKQLDEEVKMLKKNLRVVVRLQSLWPLIQGLMARLGIYEKGNTEQQGTAPHNHLWSV